VLNFVRFGSLIAVLVLLTFLKRLISVEVGPYVVLPIGVNKD